MVLWRTRARNSETTVGRAAAATAPGADPDREGSGRAGPLVELHPPFEPRPWLFPGSDELYRSIYTAVAFEPSDVLAIGGVAIAGDAFDASIMRGHVARHFGSEVSYKVPLGSNVLRMPKPIIEQLCSPANLSALRRQDVAVVLIELP